MNRRSFVAAGLSTIGINHSPVMAEDGTPVLLQEAPWLSGRSAMHDVLSDPVAEPGTVQVVRVSPVLYPELAMILIHNATDHAVMLRSVNGTLVVPTRTGFGQDQAAYNVPDIIVPPNEYWIASLKIPAELSVGTGLSFAAEVNLHTKLPPIASITTLLTAIAPDTAFDLPIPGADWPIRYRNDAPYPAGKIAMFRQIFFDDSGEICGVVMASDAFEKEGTASFEMTVPNQPTVSTNGAVLGEISDSWLAHWSYAPNWMAFEQFEFGE